MDKKLELVFMPGCFDGFEGTQEDLDELTAEIQRMFETGELFEQAVLVEDGDDEVEMINNTSNRTLQ